MDEAEAFGKRITRQRKQTAQVAAIINKFLAYLYPSAKHKPSHLHISAKENRRGAATEPR